MPVNHLSPADIQKIVEAVNAAIKHDNSPNFSACIGAIVGSITTVIGYVVQIKLAKPRINKIHHLIEMHRLLFNLNEAFIRIIKFNDLANEREVLIKETNNPNIPPLEIDEILIDFDSKQADVIIYKNNNKLYFKDIEPLLKKYIQFTKTVVNYDSPSESLKAYNEINRLYNKLYKSIQSMLS